MIHFKHDVFIHHDDAKLDTIIRLLEIVIQKENEMSKELDDLTIQVQENTDLNNSAVVLIQGIAAQLAAAKDDPAKIVALSTSLKTSATSLAAAIAANTPAATVAVARR